MKSDKNPESSRLLPVSSKELHQPDREEIILNAVVACISDIDKEINEAVPNSLTERKEGSNDSYIGIQDIESCRKKVFETLIKRYITQHSLDTESVKKIQELLEKYINPLLTKLEEQQTEISGQGNEDRTKTLGIRLTMLGAYQSTMQECIKRLSSKIVTDENLQELSLDMQKKLVDCAQQLQNNSLWLKTEKPLTAMITEIDKLLKNPTSIDGLNVRIAGGQYILKTLLNPSLAEVSKWLTNCAEETRKLKIRKNTLSKSDPDQIKNCQTQISQHEALIKILKGLRNSIQSEQTAAAAVKAIPAINPVAICIKKLLIMERIDACKTYETELENMLEKSAKNKKSSKYKSNIQEKLDLVCGLKIALEKVNHNEASPQAIEKAVSAFEESIAGKKNLFLKHPDSGMKKFLKWAGVVGAAILGSLVIVGGYHAGKYAHSQLFKPHHVSKQFINAATVPEKNAAKLRHRTK